MARPRPRDVERLALSIKPFFAGKPPELVGATLAELLATFIAGHHPDLREKILQLHFDAVRELIPVCEAEIFSVRPRPKEWPPVKA